jgi:hypothetical protein
VPISSKELTVSVERSKKNSALSRHKKWLYDLQVIPCAGLYSVSRPIVLVCFVSESKINARVSAALVRRKPKTG